MRFMSKLGILVAVAGLVALMAGPVSAADVTISCDPAGNTAIPSTQGNVTLTGTLQPSLCFLPGAATIDGNLIVTGTVQVRVIGTINGNVEANNTLPAGVFAVDVRPGSINSNVIQEGTGSIRVVNGSISGNLEQKGTGVAAVIAQLGGAARVGGNVINEGAGSTNVFIAQGGTVVVDGNVEAKGGGGGAVSEVGVTVNGGICGVAGPLNGAVVNGDIKPAC